MEVGAVKQAFNNEVILLKKKLNQAKIQIIHKLTRKAKTLTEKKVPEKLKGKFNKKAESAVKEVLIIKKINAKDLAKFIVTHKGNLNDYLNRPQVDEEKACARLLLHKALQDKYKFIRERFSNVSIEDLFMSRLERKKMKKEAREKQKEKKKRKDGKEPIQVEGDWNVEDIEMDDSKMNVNSLGKLNSDDDDGKETDDEQADDDEQSDVDKQSDDDKQTDVDKQSDVEKQSDVDNQSDNDKQSDDDKQLDSGNENEVEEDNESDEEDFRSKGKKMRTDEPQDSSSSDDETESKDVGAFVKLTPNRINVVKENKIASNKVAKVSDNEKKKNDKKPKDANKNKNLKDKILKKKFHKTTEEMPVKENKIVDPFFITSTGENYMSVAEPRPPDEFKEVHRQGNRQYRRAVMFGHVPKSKPRRENFRPDNKGFRSNGSEPKGQQKRFNKEDNYKGKFNDRRNDKKDVEVETKPEKLHPSWEAKKRQSGILPFKGKKIVFDET